MNYRNFFSCLIALIFALSSCAKNSEEKAGEIQPPNIILDAFNILYPKAQNTGWKVSPPYYVITFENFSLDNTAWLTFQGDYMMLKTELPVSDIPINISDAISIGKYKDWNIQSVDTIAQVNMGTRYVIEMKSNENAKSTLLYTKNGNIVMEYGNTPITYAPVVIPKAAIDSISKNYPAGVIMYYMQENKLATYKVESGKELFTGTISL